MRRIFSSFVSGTLMAAVLTIASPAVAHTSQEAANKQVVLGFYDALNAGDAAGTTAQNFQKIAETFLAPEYKQHSESLKNLPGSGSDRDKLIRMFQNMPPPPPSAKAMPPAKRVAVMADEDLVMLLLQRDMVEPSGETRANFIFNMFRVKDGKLTEHWEVASGMRPPKPSADGAPPLGVVKP